MIFHTSSHCFVFNTFYACKSSPSWLVKFLLSSSMDFDFWRWGDDDNENYSWSFYNPLTFQEVHNCGDGIKLFHNWSRSPIFPFFSFLTFLPLFFHSLWVFFISIWRIQEEWGFYKKNELKYLVIENFYFSLGTCVKFLTNIINPNSLQIQM